MITLHFVIVMTFFERIATLVKKIKFELF